MWKVLWCRWALLFLLYMAVPKNCMQPHVLIQKGQWFFFIFTRWCSQTASSGKLSVCAVNSWTVGSWNVTVSAGSTRAVKSLSKNDKFRKARDVFKQICDELSEENEIEEFEHKLDMFRGILDAVKDRRRVHWLTDSAFYTADAPQSVTVSADCEPTAVTSTPASTFSAGNSLQQSVEPTPTAVTSTPAWLIDWLFEDILQAPSTMSGDLRA